MMVLALGAAACGDSDDDTEYGPTLRESDAESICAAACERTAVCDGTENPLLQPCIDACVPVLVDDSTDNKCKYKSSNIRACANAYDDLSCDDVAARVGPTACTWECTLGTSSSVAAPF
jgi:hypothetical protein